MANYKKANPDQVIQTQRNASCLPCILMKMFVGVCCARTFLT